jgi:hypothetical protein
MSMDPRYRQPGERDLARLGLLLYIASAAFVVSFLVYALWPYIVTYWRSIVYAACGGAWLWLIGDMQSRIRVLELDRENRARIVEQLRRVTEDGK